jgi:hypothetical protein
MTDAPLYTYNLSGRRPATVFVLCLSVVMMAFGVHYTAPWYFLVPLGLAAGMALWATLTNPQTGSRLTGNTLTFCNRGTKESVPVGEIASMTVQNWTDGPDTVVLHLISGRAVAVPGLCADSKLAIALRELGIKEGS